MILKNYPKRKRQIVINYILPKNINWSILDDVEITIIKMRWGFDPYIKKHCHREIATKLGKTISRISHMESIVLKKLRENQ